MYRWNMGIGRLLTIFHVSALASQCETFQISSFSFIPCLCLVFIFAYWIYFVFENSILVANISEISLWAERMSSKRLNTQHEHISFISALNVAKNKGF